MAILTPKTNPYPNMQKQTFTAGDVAEASRNAFVRLKNDLPPEIAGRLIPGKVALRHGTDIRIFQYNAWDACQPGVLDHKHINYSVIYDPLCRYHFPWKQRGGPCNLFCRYYMNKQRTYDKNDVVIPALWEEMRKAERHLYGWEAFQNDQIIALMHPFDAASVEELQEGVYQAFLELIPLWHPTNASFCDQYGAELTPEAVRGIIAGRTRYQPSVPRLGGGAEYTRHVPSKLRQEVFERDGRSCLKCGCSASELHADHILPVALGGTTKLSNLQTLCGPCNLKKGHREQVDYRKKTGGGL